MICGMSSVAIANDAIETDQETTDKYQYDGKPLSGPNSIEFNQNKTITVSSDKSYSGNTYIESGRINLGHNDVFATDKTLSIAEDGTLNLNGKKQTVGKLVGNGVIQMSGSGKLYVEYAEGTESQTIKHAFYDADGSTLGFKFIGDAKSVVLAATQGNFSGTLYISNANLLGHLGGTPDLILEGASFVVDRNQNIRSLQVKSLQDKGKNGASLVFAHDNEYSLHVQNGIVADSNSPLTIDFSTKTSDAINLLKADDGISRTLITSDSNLGLSADHIKVSLNQTKMYNDDGQLLAYLDWVEEKEGLKVTDKLVTYDYKLSSLTLVGTGDNAVSLSQSGNYENDYTFKTKVQGEGDIAVVGGHVKFSKEGEYLYTGKTLVKRAKNWSGNYNDTTTVEFQIEGGADISSSEMIDIEYGAQARFFVGDHAIKALGGKGRVLIDAGATVTINDSKTSDQTLKIENEFIIYGALSVKRDEIGKVEFAAQETPWSYEQSQMIFEKSLLSLGDAGTYEKLYNINHLTLGEETTLTVVSHDTSTGMKNLHFNGGELQFTGTVLDEKYKDSNASLNVHGQIDAKQSAVLNVEFNKQAEAGFSLWNNQKKFDVALVQTNSLTGGDQFNANFIDATVSSSNDYKYFQTLDQNSDGTIDANLHWSLYDKGWTDNPNSWGYKHLYLYSAVLDQISLVNTKANEGYKVVADEAARELKLLAKLTGEGNIIFSKDTSLVDPTITVNNTNNDYTGITTVENGLTVVLASSNAFGKTKLLNNVEGGVVELNKNVQQKVGQLLIAKSENDDKSVLIMDDGSSLFIVGNDDSKISTISGDKALSGSGGIEVATGLTLSVGGSQSSYIGQVTLENGATLVLKQGGALENASVEGADSDEDANATVLVDSDSPTKLTGKFTGNETLVVANNTQLTLDSASNFSGVNKVEFKAPESGDLPSLTLDSTTIAKLNDSTASCGPTEINTTNGNLSIKLTDTNSGSKDTATIQQTVTGGGGLYLESDSKDKFIAFSISKDKDFSFTGNVHASNVSLKNSDTYQQFENATVVLESNAKYVVDDDDATIGSLTVNESSILDFARPALPGTEQTEFVLNVKGTLKIDGGTVNVADGVVDSITTHIGTSNLLEQDDGFNNTRVVLATSKDGVSVSNATLTVDGKPVNDDKQTFKISQGQNDKSDIEGTYKYVLRSDDENKTLYVTYGLESVNVKTGSLVLGTSADAAGDATIFQATITGDGGLVINTASESVTLAAGNSYKGYTEVKKGNLILAADKALNETSGLNTAENTTVTITTGEQYVKGQLDVGGSLKLQNGAHLKFEGGKVATLTTEGANALESTDGITITKLAEIKGANDNLSGTVTIDQNAVANINDVGGLGSGNIGLNGTLNLDLGETTTGVFDNVLTGSGLFNVASGTVTVSAFSNDLQTGYKGRTTVNKGATLIVAEGSSLGQTSGLTNDGTVDASHNDLKVYGKTDNTATGTLVVGDKTFTTESYNGVEGSQININTGLYDDKGLWTGKMIVEGDATGKSTVNVAVSAESKGGVLEHNQLVVVDIAGESTLDLKLGNKVEAGGYTYSLLHTGERKRWYLYVSKTGGGDGMSTSEMKTPESGARAGLAFLATEAFDLSLRGHVGDRVYTDPVTGEERESSFWMIQMGNWSSFGDTTGQLDFDGRTFVTHMGSDIYKRVNEDSDLRFGLLGSFADISYDVESNITGMTADAKSDGWSVGAYAYWQTTEESGPFANAQIRWNRFNNEVTGELTTTDKYHADGMSLTVEGGWTYRLYTRKPTDGQSGLAWNIEPRVHAHWTPFDTESDVDSKGQSYETDGKGNLALWLGVRTNLKMTDRTMPTWDNPAVNLFAEGHWVHNTRDFSSTVTSELGSSTAVVGVRDFGEARLGAVAHFNEDFVLWGDVNYRAGESNYESVGFTLGAKYHF